jgi:hypothetical protein
VWVWVGYENSPNVFQCMCNKAKDTGAEGGDEARRWGHMYPFPPEFLAHVSPGHPADIAYARGGMRWKCSTNCTIAFCENGKIG